MVKVTSSTKCTYFFKQAQYWTKWKFSHIHILNIKFKLISNDICMVNLQSMHYQRPLNRMLMYKNHIYIIFLLFVFIFFIDFIQLISCGWSICSVFLWDFVIRSLPFVEYSVLLTKKALYRNAGKYSNYWTWIKECTNYKVELVQKKKTCLF